MLKSFFQKTLGTIAAGPYSLQLERGFPYVSWYSQKTYYEDLRRWYRGDPLNEEIKQGAQTAEKYPIKINPLKQTCRKHTAVLFGLNVDSMKMKNLPVSFIPSGEKEKKKRGKEVIEKVMKVMSRSNLTSTFISNGIISQYLGGSVLAAKWRPDLGEDGEIEITAPDPDEFVGVPDGANYFRLREGWIVREIDYLEARSYFPDLVSEDSTIYYYTEWWTPTKYRIAINGRVIEKNGEKLEGKNPFGVVPMVYIPHIREGRFIGESLITEFVKGVIKEMNLRDTDIGDAVSEDSHTITAGRNMTSTPKYVALADGKRILDLGSSTGLSEADKPDLWAVSVKSASEPMLKFADRLETMYRREVDHPAVADGEDQGSQRSSLTLNTRMWPLVSHVEMERANWSAGLSVFIEILIKMMAEKKLDGITKEDAQLSFITKWAPMLPRDRETLINEISLRASSEIGSKRHLMSLTDDIDDPDTEFERMVEEKKKIAEATAKDNPLGGKDGKPGFGGKSGQVDNKIRNSDYKSGAKKPPDGASVSAKSSDE